ncbi:hypothetical protein V1291_002610 [Nitrobacteraceae bacterium AZCC 1564]
MWGLVSAGRRMRLTRGLTANKRSSTEKPAGDGRITPFHPFFFSRGLRMVNRALPRPVPMVRIPQRL